MILRSHKSAGNWVMLQRADNFNSIAFVNGCWDILSASHIMFLNWVREQTPGYVILAAVNSDDSVRRLKGAGRPINTCRERMEVLSALRAVDAVVAFDEDTPEKLIKFLYPDLLAKGGDYKGKKLVGEDFVVGNGGKVLIAPEWPGHSTDVIERIKRNE